MAKEEKPLTLAELLKAIESNNLQVDRFKIVLSGKIEKPDKGKPKK